MENPLQSMAEPIRLVAVWLLAVLMPGITKMPALVDE